MLAGAIDIGSNAVRFLVASRIQHQGASYVNRIEYMRYPLRLGEEVFAGQPIPTHKVDKLCKLMEAYRTLFEVFEVEGIAACATSAMRQAANGPEVVAAVFAKTGIQIEIISGEKEAALLYQAMLAYIDDKAYLHVDVGGGSTEINIFLNKQKIAGRSFELGTVRAVQGTQDQAVWHAIETWMQQIDMPTAPITLGTGGNIRKIYELCQPVGDNAIDIAEITALRKRLAAMDLEERMYALRLNHDRADVIIPAADIYLQLMQWSGSTKLIGPSIGLIDGIAAQILNK